jgi:hypothetical protein
MYELRVVRERRPGYGSRVKIRTAQDVYEAFRSRAQQTDREVFLALALDGKNQVLGFHVVSVGSLTAALVPPREVFKVAILTNAAAIILIHNHPIRGPGAVCGRPRDHTAPQASRRAAHSRSFIGKFRGERRPSCANRTLSTTVRKSSHASAAQSPSTPTGGSSNSPGLGGSCLSWRRVYADADFGSRSRLSLSLPNVEWG